MDSGYVTIIGGANMDIMGSPYGDLNANDSNPGKSLLSLGGVARNIAENLARLGSRVELITAVGRDSHGREIISKSKDLGISLDHSLVLEGERSSTYLCINNREGEMEVAISDMEIIKFLDPKYLEGKMEVINQGLACVLDTNLARETLIYIMSQARVPIFLDTVSVPKTKLIMDSLSNIHTLKPNLLEAELLAGIKIQGPRDYELATDLILDRGVERIFMTLGSKGVYYNDGRKKASLPALASEIVNSTGAGDSFMAAVIWAYLHGLDIEESAKAGLAASHICIGSDETVAPHMSAEKIRKLMKNNWR